MSLKLPQPFDADWILGFLRARQAPAIETIGERSIARTIRVDGRRALLRIDVGPTRVTARTSAELTPAALRALIRRMLDLDTDLNAFAAHVQRDRLLAPLLRARPGLRVPQFLDPFECVVRAILGQQVSVRAATTLVNRLAVMFDGFPAADEIASAGPDRLRSIGLTATRSRTLHATATAVAEKRIDLEALRSAEGEAAQAALDALPGIGPWTASYIRMRGLGDRDAFPAADLGVLKALGVTAAEAERRSQRWRPWRAYVAMHLWSSLG